MDKDEIELRGMVLAGKVRIAELEARLAEERNTWRQTAEELPGIGRHVALVCTDRYWNTPEGVPDACVSTTGYLSEAHGRKYWSVFGERGMELDAFDLWALIPTPEELGAADRQALAGGEGDDVFE